MPIKKFTYISKHFLGRCRIPVTSCEIKEMNLISALNGGRLCTSYYRVAIGAGSNRHGHSEGYLIRCDETAIDLMEKQVSTGK